MERFDFTTHKHQSVRSFSIEIVHFLEKHCYNSFFLKLPIRPFAHLRTILSIIYFIGTISIRRTPVCQTPVCRILQHRTPVCQTPVSRMGQFVELLQHRTHNFVRTLIKAPREAPRGLNQGSTFITLVPTVGDERTELLPLVTLG
jgi:hypothetical protein